MTKLPSDRESIHLDIWALFQGEGSELKRAFRRRCISYSAGGYFIFKGQLSTFKLGSNGAVRFLLCVSEGDATAALQQLTEESLPQIKSLTPQEWTDLRCAVSFMSGHTGVCVCGFWETPFGWFWGGLLRQSHIQELDLLAPHVGAQIGHVAIDAIRELFIDMN